MFANASKPTAPTTNNQPINTNMNKTNNTFNHSNTSNITNPNNKIINNIASNNTEKEKEGPIKPNALKNNIFLMGNQDKELTTKEIPKPITVTTSNAPSRVSSLLNKFNSAKIQTPAVPTSGAVELGFNLLTKKNENPDGKTKEEIEEERNKKREQMKLKLGNSQKKLQLLKEPKKDELEPQKNTGENTIKIKSMASLFENKIGGSFMNRPNQVTNNPNNNINISNISEEKNEKLKKLYGEDIEYEKEIEIKEDSEGSEEDESKDVVASLKKVNSFEVSNRIRTMSNNPLMMRMAAKNQTSSDLHKVKDLF